MNEEERNGPRSAGTATPRLPGRPSGRPRTRRHHARAGGCPATPWVTAALLLVLAFPVGAQEGPGFEQQPPDTVREWTGEAELSASVFFGNTDQKIALTRGTVERMDSTTGVAAEARFNYGEAALDGGEPSVIKRSWVSRLTGEYRPFRAVSPIAMVGVESSLEKRIDRRYNAGAGARVDVVARDRSQVGWSAMLLAERTSFDPPPEPAEAAPPEDEELLRWSTTLRVRHELDGEALVFASETSYRPEFDSFDRFTLDSANSISYSLSDDLSLKLSVVDEYDSEAEARGARSNNDGQILFGLLSTF